MPELLSLNSPKLTRSKVVVWVCSPFFNDGHTTTTSSLSCSIRRATCRTDLSIHGCHRSTSPVRTNLLLFWIEQTKALCQANGRLRDQALPGRSSPYRG